MRATIRPVLRPALAAALLLAALPAAAAPQITADEIVDIAKSGVGSNYVWGGGCWDPSNRSWKGADCSGFVAKTWQVPDRSPTTECTHPYSTYNFYNEAHHWKTIDRAQMKRADAFVRRANGSGHIILFASGDGWGSAEVYEARGTSYGIVHRTATIGSEYKAIRRNDLIDPAPPEPELDASLVRREVDTAGAVCPGQTVRVAIELHNSGQLSWSDQDQPDAGKAVRLGRVEGADLGLPARVSLTETAKPRVAPGERVTFVLEATAPSQVGQHEARWQLVSELVRWFGPEVKIAISVSHEPPGAGESCDTGQAGSCAVGTRQCTEGGLICKPPQGCQGSDDVGVPISDGDGTDLSRQQHAAQPADMIGSCALSRRPAAGASLPLLLLALLALHLGRRRR